MVKFTEVPKLDEAEKQFVVETLKPLLKQNKILKARAILNEIDNDGRVNIVDFLLYHLQDAYFKDSDEIFDWEFHDSKMVSIDIPSWVTTIREGAFKGCEDLESIEIPKSVKTIEMFVFQYCPLKSIVIPDGVDMIYSYTFYGCKHLESVTIPESVKYIEGLAFGRCDSLKQVSVPKNTGVDIGAFDKHTTIDRY